MSGDSGNGLISDVVIGSRAIGPSHPPYIVAELSANHNGSIERAKELIYAAYKAGADAIKLQTYKADSLTIKSDKDEFKIRGGIWDGYNLYDLYKQAETPFEWHKSLFDYAEKIGITCFSTPFDEAAVDLLEDLNSPAYKIASFEVVDLSLVKYVARTGKPMIISTGMATLSEINEVIDAAKSEGCRDLIILHCISAYPAPVAQSNLLTIPDLINRFNVVSGLSDHSLGAVVSVASVALGASFIEKHFTLSRSEVGPDSKFSLEPKEFEILCQDAASAWEALGVAGYEKKPSENANLQFRRSLYFVKPLSSGQVITEDDIRSIRPGYGLSPKYYEEILGKKVVKNVSYGDATSFDVIEP